MGNELRYIFLLETRRLLLLIGVVFGLFLFVQYFETSKSQVASTDDFPSRSTSNDPTVTNNVTQFSSSNFTDLNVASATNVIDNFDLGHIRTLNDTSNDDIELEDDPLLEDFVGVNHDSNIELGIASNTSVLLDHDGIGAVVPISERNEDKLPDPETSSVAKSPPNLISFPPQNPEINSSVSASPILPMVKDAENILQKNENPTNLKADSSAPTGGPSISSTKGLKGLKHEVATISKMNDMLLQSRISYKTEKPRWTSPVDQELLKAKSLIETAPIVESDARFDVSLYQNFSEFIRSYELMEQTLKVYTYAEGERPIFHQPPLKGIYASEGWFMKLLKSSKKFATKNPKKAHLFYLPFSSRMLEVALYVPDSHNSKPLIQHLTNYVQMIKTKHNFWNRTDGADHFLVACHDWAPAETRRSMANCIRALCNADVREGFRLGKDASLPETFVKTPQNPLRQLGGKPPSQRRILAFFAGNMHGYLRPILLSHWENKDPDMKIFGMIKKAKGQISYAQYMKSSKYCICARGYEVNSPRVVEAIFYECVPVIISDNFVPPFFETLNWESFAVFVMEKDIPNLKKILLSISKKRYVAMQKRVKKVQQHFLWHSRPVKYDAFHMILHSIWYNRLLQTKP
ncbi:hypothetical protein ACS0TY_012412 [Phlomoides rotata]